jgi:hypothetical protein
VSSLSLCLCCWFGGLLAGLHAYSLVEGQRSVEEPVPPYRYVRICNARARFCGTAFSDVQSHCNGVVFTGVGVCPSLSLVDLLLPLFC